MLKPIVVLIHFYELSDLTLYLTNAFISVLSLFAFSVYLTVNFLHHLPQIHPYVQQSEFWHSIKLKKKVLKLVLLTSHVLSDH